MATKSAEETKQLGRELAKTLQGCETVALFGEAGSGKTVFAKGLCEGLGVLEPVTSPTFVIQNVYRGKFAVFHYDMYRVSGKDCCELGFFESLGKGVNIIEWAENIKEILPEDCIKIYFEFGKSENEREIRS